MVLFKGINVDSLIKYIINLIQYVKHYEIIFSRKRTQIRK